MSQEITATTGLSVLNGEVSWTATSASTRIDQSGSRMLQFIQDIGTGAHEALQSNSDLTDQGLAWFKNLDSTNYVEIGIVHAATWCPVIRLKAKECAVLRVTPAVALYAKADTATVKLHFAILEN